MGREGDRTRGWDRERREEERGKAGDKGEGKGGGGGEGGERAAMQTQEASTRGTQKQRCPLKVVLSWLDLPPPNEGCPSGKGKMTLFSPHRGLALRAVFRNTPRA